VRSYDNVVFFVVGGNPYNCKACVHPLRFDRASSRCIQCCQQRTNQEDCCHCDVRRHAQRDETPLSRGYDGKLLSWFLKYFTPFSKSAEINRNLNFFFFFFKGECHFVSRRVSETEERQISPSKWNDSTVLGFFWLSFMSLIVIFIVVIHHRRRRRSSLLAGYGGDDDVDFKFRKVPESRNKYDALYTPVSLSPCDEDDEDVRTSLVGPETRSDLDSGDEKRTLVKPLVLNTWWWNVRFRIQVKKTDIFVTYFAFMNTRTKLLIIIFTVGTGARGVSWLKLAEWIRSSTRNLTLSHNLFKN